MGFAGKFPRQNIRITHIFIFIIKFENIIFVFFEFLKRELIVLVKFIYILDHIFFVL